VTATYLERLGARIARTGSVLCVGIDPDPAGFPEGFSADADGVTRFARLLVTATAPYAAAFKPNLAYFEALGTAGWSALETLRAAIPDDIPVIADAKRGDIGPTAAKQARAIVDVLGADAVTVSPYLGRDAVEPFVERGAFAYVLCRTSNPSAGELQDVEVGAAGGTEPLYLRVARTVESWDVERGVHGLVVGATAPDELSSVRRVAPALPFLVPGVGAQGGSLEIALRYGPARAGAAADQPGGLLLVNVSRGIAQAATNDVADLGAALSAAAESWARRARVLDSITGPPRGS
jgi:orotidine-5'-phosphate decarboxylase